MILAMLLKGSSRAAEIDGQTFGFIPSASRRYVVFQNPLIRLATIVALALCVESCGDDESTSPSAEADNVTEYVASVSIDGTDGTLRAQGVPVPTGGPNITVNGHLTVVNGGVATMSVTSPTPFERGYVARSGPIPR